MVGAGRCEMYEDDDLSFEKNYKQLESSLKPGLIKYDQKPLYSPASSREKDLLMHENLHNISLLSSFLFTNPLGVSALLTTAITIAVWVYSWFLPTEINKLQKHFLDLLSQNPIHASMIIMAALIIIFACALFITVFTRTIRAQK